MEIEEYLRHYGIRTNLKGFDYLVYAIELCSKDKSYLRAITKRLYPDMAKDLNCTPVVLERAMRYSIYDAKIEKPFGMFIADALLDLKALNKK